MGFGSTLLKSIFMTRADAARVKEINTLRYFKVKQENNPARFFLQELMFYTCFDEKTYDEWHTDELCIEAYLKKEAEIKARS